jgi:FAD/FMN-containing dehydrogenase
MATLLHEPQIAWARPRVSAYPADEAHALEKEIRKRIEGEVRFDAGSRALYATDGSNYRQVPIGVAIPKTVEDVLETVETVPPPRRRIGSPKI